MMKIRLLNFLKIMICILVIGSCTTDPFIPAGGIPLDPPVEDPGDENPCASGIISFQHQVLPILVSSCAYSGCHDPITAADDIVLDRYQNIIKELSAGDPNNSELYESIIETDPDDIMPPPPASPLTNDQITIIRDWISQGAKETICGTSCDSTAASFALDIFPLIQDYCIGCHNTARPDGDVNLESYAKMLPYVENGVLIGTMKHEALFAPMPPTGSKLSNCRINQIQKWINEGAQNN